MKRQQSAPSKPSRQERRQAARDDAKAQRTVETSSPLTEATSYSRQDALAFFALGLMVFVSYLPAMLWGGFVWDDRILTLSQAIPDWSGLWRLWSGEAYSMDDTPEAHYWPLVYTTFWLEHKLWGFDPAGYHIVNVLLHLANTLLLWHLLQRLAVPGAWMVAAVFAVHPLHVESVAWVIERKDVLSGLFYLAASLAWLRFVEQPNPRRYVCSLALYVAGLLSKSIVVTLPAALLIWHWWKQGRVTSTDLLRLVPFCVVGLVITVGDLSFSRSVEPLSLGYSFTERTLIAARALWFYAGKLLWPSDLAVIYPLWDIRVSDPLAWGYLIAAVALALALWNFRLQLGRGPLAGALFFAVTLLPVLGFIDYGYMEYAFVADRFQYLAGIGVMAVVIGAAAYGVGCLSDLWQKGALGIVALALVVLGMLTWQQASIWRNKETLWRHVVALNPQARDAHLSLSKALYRQEQYVEALEATRVAVAQRPDYYNTHATLGAILNALGRFEEAETHLRRAITLHLQGWYAHLHLGDALYKQGRYEEALEATRVAVAQRPNYYKAHADLGLVLNALGHFEEAEAHLRRALVLHPQAQDVHLHLGDVLYNQGRYEEALEATRVALAQAPNFEAHVNLGAIFNALGRFEEAEAHLRRALALNPQAQVVHLNLGDALYKQGRYEEALEATRVALAQAPNHFEAYVNLGAMLAARGFYEEVIDVFAQAVALNPDSPQVAELYFLMGQAAQDNGQPEAAEYYMRAFEIDSHHAKAIRRLAYLRLEQQRYDETLELFQRLIAIDSGDAVAYGNMGIVLFYLGRSDEALESFDQALSLDPTLESARTNREAVLEAMKENAE